MEYRYRIMHRKLPGEWVLWMGKVYYTRAAVDRQIQNLRENNEFFGWERSYCVQRQPINTDWENIDG